MRYNDGSKVDNSRIRISSEVTWPGEPLIQQPGRLFVTDQIRPKS